MRWAAVAAACLMVSAPGSHGAPSVPRPEVIVLVSAGPDGNDTVAITYARAVSDKAARSDLDALLRLTHWPARGVVIDTARLVRDTPKMTSVSFAAPMVVPYPEGMLPVAPFILAYKQYRSLVVVFQPQRQFGSKGPASYEDRQVKVELQENPGSYRYNVWVADAAFTSLSLPAKTAAGTQESPDATGKAAPPRVLILVLAFGLAISVGLAVYALVAARVGRKRVPRS